MSDETLWAQATALEMASISVHYAATHWADDKMPWNTEVAIELRAIADELSRRAKNIKKRLVRAER